jgi:hypothetical protein
MRIIRILTMLLATSWFFSVRSSDGSEFVLNRREGLPDLDLPSGPVQPARSPADLVYRP